MRSPTGPARVARCKVARSARATRSDGRASRSC
jgi:hypothetical protein